MHNKTAEITISNFISMQVSTFISIYKEHDIPSLTPATVRKTSFFLFFNGGFICSAIAFSVSFLSVCEMCRNTTINQLVRLLVWFCSRISISLQSVFIVIRLNFQRLFFILQMHTSQFHSTQFHHTIKFDLVWFNLKSLS